MRKDEDLNKIFILKNCELDGALFSNNKDKKLSKFIEYLNNFGETDLIELHKCFLQNNIADLANEIHV